MPAVLYSFRRCPYAMRARMAIAYSGILLELREVSLKNKPAELTGCSPKATVPVLVLPGGQVIDESRDIMLWALAQDDPDGWLDFPRSNVDEMHSLLDMNDGEFKQHLDHYKYAERFPDHPRAFYRTEAEAFLELLEQRLSASAYLFADRISYADIAVFPFIRQFAYVDINGFENSAYVRLHAWLKKLLASALFEQVMPKYAVWKTGDALVMFPRVY